MPEIRKEVALTRIVRDLGKRLDRQMRHRHEQSVPFSYAGAVAVSTSTPWVPHTDTGVFEVLALLGTAGSSSTVVEVDVNGSSIGTVTLASSVTSNSAALSSALVADTDIVTVSVTTAGTGAEDLTVLLRVA